MAINEWRIWKRLRIVKEEEKEEVKVKDDLNAVISSLKDIDVSELLKRLERMKSMAREREVIDEKLKGNNLEKQINLLDDILQRYSFLEDDFDINGLRLRKIGKELLNKAKEKGMTDLVKEKNKDMKWK